MSLQKFCEQVEGRLTAATPGPWFIDGSEVRHDCAPGTTNSGISDCTVQICDVHRISEHLDHKKHNRELIAHAPSDLTKAIAVIEKFETFVKQLAKQNTESEYAADHDEERDVDGLSDVYDFFILNARSCLAAVDGVVGEWKHCKACDTEWLGEPK